MRDEGGDIMAHLEADLAECLDLVVKDANGSANWWRARASGVAHAIDLIRRERTSGPK